MRKVSQPQLNVSLLYFCEFGDGHMQNPGCQLDHRRPFFFYGSELLKFGKQFSHKSAVIDEPLQQIIVISNRLLEFLTLFKAYVLIRIVLLIFLVLFRLPFHIAPQPHYFFNFDQDLIT